MERIVKRELQSTGSDRGRDEGSDSRREDVSGRRLLRSGYHAVKTRIHDERDEIMRADSTKFKELFEHVEDLHKRVQNPREQVADAEALLDITSSLLSSVKAVNKEGITPSKFISSLLTDFRQKGGPKGGTDSVVWKDIGAVVSHIFSIWALDAAPCNITFDQLIGPMDAELKKKRTCVRRRHVRPTESSKPGEVDDIKTEKTDTDKNMSTMFNILKKNRRVRLENIVLNRNSFAQTVENLFALSFLIKDGRAEIRVDEKGYHLVSPRNAPASSVILSGEVAHCHFVFRFDYNDWKLMTCSIAAGNELMPHRQQEFTSYSQGYPVFAASNNSQPEPVSGTSDHCNSDSLRATIPTAKTQSKKISRNRSDSPESNVFESCTLSEREAS